MGISQAFTKAIEMEGLTHPTLSVAKGHEMKQIREMKQTQAPSPGKVDWLLPV